MKKVIAAVFAAALVCLSFAHNAHAAWTLASGTQGAETTMTDGTATLKVKVLDTTARTLRLGYLAPSAEIYNSSQSATGGDKSWELDLSMPITLSGSSDTWAIVEVGASAFFNMKKVSSPASGLDLSSVTNIGNGAFMYCKGFPKILLSPHLVEVGTSAFCQNNNTVEFVPQLPPSLRKVGAGAFAHHTKYDTGDMMKLAGTVELLGLEEIHGCVFNYLPGVSNIVVGSKLTIVDTEGATTDSMDNDGKSPFAGLSKLQEITFLGDAPSTLPAAFLSDQYHSGNSMRSDSAATLTVTCYLYEDYTNGWVTAMAATGGTIADYTDANNERVFAKWTGGNGSRTVLLALLEGHPASDTEPQFNTAPTIEKSGMSLVFTGRLSEGRGALSAVFTETDGTTEHVYPLTSGEVQGDADETAYTMTFDLSSGATGLPQNKTYTFAIRGSNSENEVVTKAGVGTFFFGAVDVSVDNASTSENGGSLTYTVSRAGTDGALNVPLAFSGTATEFANFRETVHEVTIPNGESSMSFAVTPVVALDSPDATLSVAGSGTALFFVGATATATIADWDEPAVGQFSGSTTFTAAGCSLAQGSALAHFPVLVRIPAGTVAAIADSSNLAFFQDGSLLPHEIDTWSADGALVWVGMDSLYTNAVVTCAWGKSGYSAPNLAHDLWREAGYVAVWHLGESGDGSVSVSNSTVVGPALAGSSSSTSKANAEGAVGSARTVSTARSSDGRIKMPSPDAYLESATRFTVSFWMNQASTGAGRDEYIAGSAPNATSDFSGWLLRKLVPTGEDTDMDIYFSRALNTGTSIVSNVFATASTPGEWVFLSASFDNIANPPYRMSRNGATNTNSTHCYATAETPFVFGNVYQSGQAGLTGAMDEIRLRRVVSSEAWLAAETAAVKDENFMQGERAQSRGTMLLIW